MRKVDKEVLQFQLGKERIVLDDLKRIYEQALKDVEEKIKLLQWDEQSQSKIYQMKYQKQLKEQLEVILQYMAQKQYTRIQDYLNECYEMGYLGTLYTIQSEGVPLVIPIDQKAVVQAVQLDSKISGGLYKSLGVDAQKLKKTIAQEISRGIATAMPFADIARNVHNASGSGYSNAKRIVVTEGHRIQEGAAHDSAKAAEARGAHIVRIWDSTLDRKTRATHRRLHGQKRGVNEPFEINGKKAMYAGKFGDPAEDCNCRCHILTRSEWALDDEETHYLGDTAKMTEEQLRPIADKLHISTDELRKYRKQIIPVKASSYKDFIRQYNNIWNYENQGVKGK